MGRRKRQKINEGQPMKDSQWGEEKDSKSMKDSQ
jgi:hypothetical protein